MTMPDSPYELHEGSWFYVSASVQPLDSVLAACRRHGWPVVVGSDDLGAGRRIQALRLADACIVDLSTSSPEVEEELTVALRERRPVIALRSARVPSLDRPDVRELSFRDGADCRRQLDRLLTDPSWQRDVALATPSDEHE
jgi:hypothetical protein